MNLSPEEKIALAEIQERADKWRREKNGRPKSNASAAANDRAFLLWLLERKEQAQPPRVDLRRVMQTRLGYGGNCVAACLATLAGCELARVDFSALTHPKDWDEIARQKLLPLGLGFIHIPGKRFPIHGGDSLYIGHGPSPRGPVEHAVILRGDRLVHDPHPDGGGIVSVTGVSFVVTLPLQPQPKTPHPCEVRCPLVERPTEIEDRGDRWRCSQCGLVERKKSP